MYCYVDVDEHSVLKYQKLARGTKTRSAPAKERFRATFSLEMKPDFRTKGSSTSWTTTSTRRPARCAVRGVLTNKSGKLTPGLFARLRVPGSGRYHACSCRIQPSATTRTSTTCWWWTTRTTRCQVRPVQLGALFGGLRSIVSGISADDRIMVNGQMHARPGTDGGADRSDDQGG